MLFSLGLQDIKVSLWLPRKGMSLVGMDTAFDGLRTFLWEMFGMLHSLGERNLFPWLSRKFHVYKNLAIDTESRKTFCNG